MAIKTDEQITGIEVSYGDGVRQKVSTIVDDTTVFLYEAAQLPTALRILEHFGKLSGLQVKPRKSNIIFLNLEVHTTELYGIPVLQHGDTTRYLDYYVRTGEVTDTNWAAIINNVQRSPTTHLN